MNPDRREFLAAVLGGAALVSQTGASGAVAKPIALAGAVGITTGTFSSQLNREPKRFQLPELLKVIRGELDMRVVDAYSPSLASFEPGYLDSVRAAAGHEGCVLTNLKLNQRGLDLGSRDEAVRARSLAEYRRGIDAAARLGMRWARPLPTAAVGSRELMVEGMRQLADYAAERNVRLLVENFGWMQSDADAAPALVRDIGRNVAASPDTGNWTTNDVRYPGLGKLFPLAVTCDFKAKQMGANGGHAAYDLRRCFQIGWASGFRGPWCIEHGNADTTALFRELRWIRDRLHEWMKEAGR